MKLWPPRAQSGVTLVELMIVLSILGILVGVVAPNYSDFIARVSVTTETRRMIGVLKQARNEARTRGATVTVQRSSTVDWGGELLVFESTSQPGNTAYNSSSSDDVISRHRKTSRAINIRDDATANGRFISFGMQGWLSSSETSEILIAVCSPTLDAEDGVYIEINRVGKIRERSIGNDTRGCL